MSTGWWVLIIILALWAMSPGMVLGGSRRRCHCTCRRGCRR